MLETPDEIAQTQIDNKKGCESMEEGFIIKIHLHPSSSKESIGGERDGWLDVYVKEKPVSGKANNAVIDLLSRTFGVKRQQIRILHGEKSRRKIVMIKARAN